MTPPVRPEPETRAQKLQRQIDSLKQQGATDADIESFVASQPGVKPVETPVAPKAQSSIIDPASRTGAALSGLAQGATLGFADEALGGIDALNHIAPKWLGGEGAPSSEFSKRYAETRDRVRAGDEAGSQAHGTTHAVASFAGGVLPFVTGGVAGKLIKPTLARAMGEGAALGGVAGFGNAQGDLTQQLEGTAAGAVVGGLGTAALRAAAAGGGKVVDAIGRSRVASAVPKSPLLNAADQAKRVLLQKLSAGGKSIDDVIAEAQSPVHAGQPTTIADLGGDAVTRVARGVQTKPNTSALVRDAFESRQRGQLDRIKDAGALHLDIAPENVPQTAADKLAEAQSASAPLFEAFQREKPIDDKTINQTLELPYFKRAFAQAKEQGLLTGQKPLKRISTTREVKPFEMDGVPLLDADGNPKIPITTVTTEEKQIPTPFLLHRTKLNMDDFVNEGASAMPGAGGAGSSVKRDLTQAIANFRDAVKSRYQHYGPALEAYAGPAGERSSLLEGGQAFRGEIRPPDVQFAVNQADSRPYFQRGAWNELLQKAGAIGDRNGEAPKDVAHVFNGSPNIREAVAHTFNDRPGFPALTDALGRESRYSRTASDILGGSPTMNKAEDLAGIAQDSAVPFKSGMAALQGSSHGLLTLLQGLANRGESQYADQVVQQLAPMVTAGIDDPRQLQGLLTQLQQFAPTLQRRSTAADAIRRALQEQMGAGTARIAAGQ